MAEGMTPALGGVRNLDVVLPGVIELHGPNKTYRLRDDIGTLLGLVFGRVQTLIAQLPSTEEAGALPMETLVARTDAFNSEILTACVALFRHTYPDISAEEVAEALPSEGARLALVTAFFSTRFARSGAQPNATPEAKASAEQPEPNRDETPSAQPPAVSPSSPAATSKSRRSSKKS